MDAVILATILGSVLTNDKVQELISALIECYCGDFIKHMKILGLCRDEEVNLVKKSLTDSILSIVSANLNNPYSPGNSDIGVITSMAFRNYDFTSDHYRKMFNTLITSTFDKSTYCNLHPSFPFIIQQISQLDANILLDIKNDKSAFIHSIYLEYSGNTEGHADDFSNFYYYKDPNENVIEDLKLTDIAIDNLLRLRLIMMDSVEIGPSKIDDKLTWLESLNNSNTMKWATGPAYRVQLTSLGKNFIKTCIGSR